MGKKTNKARAKTPRTAKRPDVSVPAREDVTLFDGTVQRLDVDAAAHIRWLETGEGEPWPPGSSS